MRKGGLLAAEVGEVSYVDENTQGLWSLKCRILDDKNNTNKTNFPISARPLDSTFKQPPLPGEIVLLMPQASNLSARSATIPEYYYLQTLNIQSSINSNRLPGVTSVEASTKGRSTDTSNTGNATNGSSEEPEPDFNESSEVRPLQVYEGDTLIEGRFGQSIRLSSTITDGTDKYTLGEPQWKKGNGTHGDAITVIRNGQKPDAGYSNKPEANKYIRENIDYDAGSIYMTSTQEIPITKASPDNVASKFLGFEQDTYKGEQVIISSGRLVFNSRDKETFIFSGGGIGLASHMGISLDSSEAGINIAGSTINLGSDASNAGEPAVLGNIANERLDAIVDYVISVCAEIAKIVVPTGVGPSGVPTNAPLFSGKLTADGEKLKTEHPKIKSKLVFLLKDPDYNSSTKPSELKPN